MKSIRKIDIHTHVRTGTGIKRMGTDTTFATPEELIGMYKIMGICKGVILPGINIECSDRIQSNEDVIHVIENYPEHFYWFCNIDPRMGKNSPNTDLSYFISYYKELGAKGVGEICCNLYFDDPYVENLFFHCEKNNMPVIFHIGHKIGECYGLVDDLGLPRLEKELQKYPDLKFLGHSQAFWSEISMDINDETRKKCNSGKVIPGRVVELMRKYPNLCGDISAHSGYNAITRDPGFGYAFIEEFQDKLYFGTDICAPGDYPNLYNWLDEALKNNKISYTAYKKICYENAAILLEI